MARRRVHFWGSNANAASIRFRPGQVSEWLKETDCKSVRIAYDGSNPSLPTRNAASMTCGVSSIGLPLVCRGSSSVGRAAASQAACRGFESLLPLQTDTLLENRYNHHLALEQHFCSRTSSWQPQPRPKPSFGPFGKPQAQKITLVQ